MSWSNDQVKKTFTYANNHLIWVITSNNIKLMETDFTLLNGVAQTAVTKTWEMNGTPKDEYLTYYLYNNLGFLVKDSIFKNGQFAGAYRYEYNNDKDLSNRKDIDANGTIVGDIDFEYDLSHLDKTGSYGQFDNSGTNEIFPRKAKHMIKSRHSKLLNNIYTYTYTYDADGYVTHGQIKNTTNGETDTFNNTWQ